MQPEYYVCMTIARCILVDKLKPVVIFGESFGTFDVSEILSFKIIVTVKSICICIRFKIFLFFRHHIAVYVGNSKFINRINSVDPWSSCYILYDVIFANNFTNK